MLENFVANALRPEPEITTDLRPLRPEPVAPLEPNLGQHRGWLCRASAAWGPTTEPDTVALVRGEPTSGGATDLDAPRPATRVEPTLGRTDASAIAVPEPPGLQTHTHTEATAPQTLTTSPPTRVEPDTSTALGSDRATPAVDTSLVSLRPTPIPPTPPTPPPTPIFSAGGVTITNLQFSGLEGANGTFQIKLAQAPTAPVTVTLAPGDFLVVDADNTVANGMQSSLTFTAQNWNDYQTVSFIAEKDGVATDRATGNAIAFTLAGGVTSNGSYDLGPITNTYAPDLNAFDITLDFRTDALGFWTADRQAIAQKAADDWADRIANEWTGLQLNQVIQPIGNDGSYTTQNFNIKAYVDDLLVVMGSLDTNGSAGGYGSPVYEAGGWFGTPDLKPRLGQVAIDISITDDDDLYNLVSHELGHVLGLIGYNWEGYLQQDLSSPQTAVFKGAYAAAANGGNFIPLQSQDGPNPITNTYDYWHPAASVRSIMSYNWLYNVSGPTEIDYALLADSGYLVYGVNQPIPIATVPPTSSVVESTDSSLTTRPQPAMPV